MYYRKKCKNFYSQKLQWDLSSMNNEIAKFWQVFYKILIKFYFIPVNQSKCTGTGPQDFAKTEFYYIRVSFIVAWNPQDFFSEIL